MHAVKRVGIVGVGSVGLAMAADLASRGVEVWVLAPRGPMPHPLESRALVSDGVVAGTFRLSVAASLAELCANCDTLIIAVPGNGHKAVMDALAPHLRASHWVLVSSMASLSALYLYERDESRGKRPTVASLGTTLLTARRTSPTSVRVMTRRQSLSLSALPGAQTETSIKRLTELFPVECSPHANALATTLSNINPIAHAPLALFNWTRIERAENWPQYHYMTPRVAAVIEALEAERLALAAAFGLTVRPIEQHFAQSFNTQASRLADIAAELHAKRGGPPGPTEIDSRFLFEDVPYGLVFCEALAKAFDIDLPATRSVIDLATLITGEPFRAMNDLVTELDLQRGGRAGLEARLLGTSNQGVGH